MGSHPTKPKLLFFRYFFRQSKLLLEVADLLRNCFVVFNAGLPFIFELPQQKMQPLFELLLKLLHLFAQFFFQISDLLPYFPFFRCGHLYTFIGKMNSLECTFPDRMERTDSFQLALHVGLTVGILAADLMLLDSCISIFPLFVEVGSAAPFGFGEGSLGIHP